MLGPGESDWGFQEIADVCPERAARLARAEPHDALIEALAATLERALTADARVGFDGVGNDLSAPRVTLQFLVPTGLYDWFFNARTGYRGQYWISPENGLALNAQLLHRLRNIIENWAPRSGVEGREIWVVKHGHDREDIDKGPHTESRDTVLASLDPRLSKIWICERLIQRSGTPPVHMQFGFVGPKLCIPRWKERGLFAPFPEEGEAWLDIKGAYVQPNGKVEQPNKSPEERADQIHKTGWT
jgi:hypothetical protein